MKDFIFSASQLMMAVQFARARRQKVIRLYLNGLEYTESGLSPLSVDSEDAVSVAINVVGASDHNPSFLMTVREDDPEVILQELEEQNKV